MGIPPSHLTFSDLMSGKEAELDHVTNKHVHMDSKSYMGSLMALWHHQI